MYTQTLILIGLLTTSSTGWKLSVENVNGIREKGQVFVQFTSAPPKAASGLRVEVKGHFVQCQSKETCFKATEVRPVVYDPLKIERARLDRLAGKP